MSWSLRLGRTLGVALVGVLILPFLALLLSISSDTFLRSWSHPSFAPAACLSLWTTALSVVGIVVGGTPLAWWLATARSRWRGWVEALVELPVVVPPAVVGVGLLRAFGRRGWLGPFLDEIGVQLPFTELAVILAQTVVAAPFYIQGAATAFRRVDPDLILVARTLGASPGEAFLRVALPVARSGLVVGASLAWARALGEFGATLIFAGNLSGRTQTLPLAIFTALESDLDRAVVYALLLVAVGATLLALLRFAGRWAAGGGGRPGQI